MAPRKPRVLNTQRAQIPIIDEQYRENKELRNQNDDLASRLADSEDTRDQLQINLASTKSSLEKLTADDQSLRSQVTDLGIQVRVLTREIAIRDDPRLANEPFDPFIDVSGKSPPDLDDIDSIITNSLVSFRSLPELVEQNRKLLMLTRQLGQKLEAKQQLNGTVPNGQDDSDIAMDDAARVISDLMEQLSKMEKQLSEAVEQKDQALRERDMYSQLTLRGQGTAVGRGSVDASGRPGALIQSMQADFGKFRDQLIHEKDSLNQRLQEKDAELLRIQESLARTQKALENQQRE
jgi:nucleoprotein TPR